MADLWSWGWFFLPNWFIEKLLKVQSYTQNAKLSWSLTGLSAQEEPSPSAENSLQIFSAAISVSPFTSVTDSGIKKGCVVEAGPHPDVSQLFKPSPETSAICANYNSMNYASGSKP